MTSLKKYEMFTNNTILENDFEKVLVFDKLSKMFLVGHITFFGQLCDFKVFKKEKLARKYFNSIL